MSSRCGCGCDERAIQFLSCIKHNPSSLAAFSLLLNTIQLSLFIKHNQLTLSSIFSSSSIHFHFRILILLHMRTRQTSLSFLIANKTLSFLQQKIVSIQIHHMFLSSAVKVLKLPTLVYTSLQSVEKEGRDRQLMILCSSPPG